MWSFYCAENSYQLIDLAFRKHELEGRDEDESSICESSFKPDQSVAMPENAIVEKITSASTVEFATV